MGSRSPYPASELVQRAQLNTDAISDLFYNYGEIVEPFLPSDTEQYLRAGKFMEYAQRALLLGHRKEAKALFSKVPMRMKAKLAPAVLRYYYYGLTAKKKNAPYDPATTWIAQILVEAEVSIVQIGSNDGKQLDPLHNLILQNRNWQVLFVEPVPYLFERLQNNYGEDARFSYANVAINDGSQQIFYHVKEDAKLHIRDLPTWYDQVGSFDRAHIVKRLNGILEPHIEEIRLSGITLATLFEENDIGALDLLHIDAEGYDWKILSQLDHTQFAPKIILFEQVHLRSSERREAVKKLRKEYRIFRLGDDFICVNRNLVSIEKISKLVGIFIA